MNLIIPQGYQSALDIRETEVAIKKVKDFFEKALAVNLNLTRVSAPLFVDPVFPDVLLLEVQNR